MEKISAHRIATDIFMQVEDTEEKTNLTRSAIFAELAKAEPDREKRRIYILASLLLMGVSPKLFGLYKGE